ncbi:MAG: RNase adapter RapZ [Chromatiaceae bacterium]|nr:RNase adapter RapZ [Gammaproteobacteria bacterium]MCP5305196.1 RNase adapter RapZ [Chromatiaceae bacterium]MCP5315155.1 RNase adapter RapZ [Chromatiaceae bacterium]
MTYDDNNDVPRVVLVTGLSGSGKSIALHVLEDVGYYCIDNLPVSLFEALVRDITLHPTKSRGQTAIGIDARNPGNELDQLPGLIKRLRDHGVDCEVVFLDAEDAVLMQRFSETRRRHPLTDDGRTLQQAIDLERKLLNPLLDLARLKIDTTRTTLHELREIIRARVAERERGEMSIMLQSFGFKHGVPRNADFVFDARCLPNPHWHPDLRPLTGKDPEVANFLGHDLQVRGLLSHISDFLTQWIPCFEREGRSYLTIAIGCTGGQHRSVYLIEELARFLTDQGLKVVRSHRELP